MRRSFSGRLAAGKILSQTQSHPFNDALIRTRLACKEGTLKAILWHQGESDLTSTQAAVDEQKLRKIISQLRTELHAEKVPAIFGALAKDPPVKRLPQADIIDCAQKKLSVELQPSGYADSAGLKVQADRLHFDRRSLMIFGIRYYEAYRSCIRK